jgi:cell division protease FtsH
VTKQAYAMVSMYGLNERVGNISYYDSTGQNEYSFGKPYSEEMARVIDQEVSKLVETQYQRAVRLLTDNKDKLSALATQLLEKEVIFKEDLEKIFGERPFAKMPHDTTRNGQPVPSINEPKDPIPGAPGAGSVRA